MTIRLVSEDLNGLFEMAHMKRMACERDLASDAHSETERSYRMRIPHGEVEVQRTILREGLEVSGYKGKLLRPLTMDFETMYPHLELSYTFEGCGHWEASKGFGQSLAPGTATLLYMPHCQMQAALTPGDEMQHMEIRIDLRRFPTLAEEVVSLADHMLYTKQIMGQLTIRQLFEQLRDCPYHGVMRQLFMEGKCYETLATCLAYAKEVSPVEETRFTRDDADSLQEARSILHHRWLNPPSLLELARMVGINDNKLKRGFKEMFDTTVFGYIRYLRMMEARRLLESGAFNVSEAASRVGYVNTSHFATAYRRAFGYNPGDCRK